MDWFYPESGNFTGLSCAAAPNWLGFVRGWLEIAGVKFEVVAGNTCGVGAKTEGTDPGNEPWKGAVVTVGALPTPGADGRVPGRVWGEAKGTCRSKNVLSNNFFTKINVNLLNLISCLESVNEISESTDEFIIKPEI